MKCSNPVCSRIAKPIVGLCSACYQYWRKTGKPRPEAVIVATGERQLIRELEARAWG